MQKLDKDNGMWLSDKGKSYEVNQKLSKDDYINELRKKKSQV